MFARSADEVRVRETPKRDGDGETASMSRAATLFPLPRRRLEMGRGRCRVCEAEGVFERRTNRHKRKVEKKQEDLRDIRFFEKQSKKTLTPTLSQGEREQEKTLTPALSQREREQRHIGSIAQPRYGSR